MFRLVLLDAGIIAASVYFTFLLRFDFSIPQEYLWKVPYAIWIYIAVHAACFFGFKAYHRIWRYTGTFDLLVLMKLSALTFAGIISINMLVHELFPDYRLPISIYASAGYVFLGTAGIRIVSRLLHDKFERTEGIEGTKGNLLIVGAGKAGIMVTNDIKHSKFKFMNPVAFIDDNPSKRKLEVMGLPIVGNRHDIPDAVKRLHIDYIIIALPTAPLKDTQEIIEICKSTTAQIKIMPSMSDILNGKMAVNMIREVSVNDLLGRAPVEINTDEIQANLDNETVLITGAGGSIGSELCRQLAVFRPKEMLLLGHGENSIYLIETELRARFPEIPIIPIIADIQDLPRIEYVFSTYCPTIVFHAAAHKHVPLMEMNPVEAVKNNVIGTKNLAEISHKYGVKRFVLISSDKAVNPTSVMGATKRVAEMIISDQNASSETIFAAVRFGNVLGSRGSVIPLFRKQIENGGPVTVTHKNMVRYFMTIPEAVQLVIQASVLAKGGEVFVLDMGKPVRIYDLAKDLIKLSGLEPEKDIPIVFTGIRPGEKLYEELLTEEEGLAVTQNRRILVSRPLAAPKSELTWVLGVFDNLCRGYELAGNQQQIRKLLKQLIPSYTGYQVDPQEAGSTESEVISAEVHAGI